MVDETKFVLFSHDHPSLGISAISEILSHIRKPSLHIEYESFKKVTRLRHNFEARCYNLLLMNPPAETFNRWYVLFDILRNCIKRLFEMVSQPANCITTCDPILRFPESAVSSEGWDYCIKYY
jgi:hypothetical protein